MLQGVLFLLGLRAIPGSKQILQVHRVPTSVRDRRAPQRAVLRGIERSEGKQEQRFLKCFPVALLRAGGCRDLVLDINRIRKRPGLRQRGLQAVRVNLAG